MTAGIIQLKETHKAVLKYDGKQQLNFSIKIKSEMLKVMENWRAPDSAQGSSGYSVQALCCHAEMQTNEARSFSRKIKNPECMQNKQIFKFSNWLNFLNTVWINRKQINQTETEPFCLFVSMDYGLWIGDLWMNCPCKLMGRSWESLVPPLPFSHLLGYHKLCILFWSRLNALHILNLYIYIYIYMLFVPLCLVFMEHHISFF